MALFTIYHRLEQKHLYSLECVSMRHAIEDAVKRGANLRGANLRGADLYGADLSGADLRGADLRRANLSGTDLRSTNLRGANLHGADLSGTDLRSTNLSGADLHGADLHGANLSGANLRGADLRGADLRGADLSGADLYGADLYGADLYGAEDAALILARISILPEQGSFEGWKLCRQKVLVRLRIPGGARRSNATGRKCRAEYVDVEEIIQGDSAQSLFDPQIIYRVGERVTCHGWEEDRFVECGGGIHFYLTRLEAENEG